MKFLIVSVPRSGSSYFGSVLKNTAFTGHVYMNEPFMGVIHDEHLDEVRNEWNKLIDSMIRSEKFIVKVHVLHLRQLERIGLLEKFKTIKFDYTYAIYREDVFESALSLVISQRTDNWARDEHGITDMYVSDEEFERCRNSITWNNKLLLDNEYNIHYDKIIRYEDLTFNRITDLHMLGFNYDGPTRRLIQQSKFRHKGNVVKNYQELKNKYDN